MALLLMFLVQIIRFPYRDGARPQVLNDLINTRWMCWCAYGGQSIKPLFATNRFLVKFNCIFFNVNYSRVIARMRCADLHCQLLLQPSTFFCSFQRQRYLITRQLADFTYFTEQTRLLAMWYLFYVSFSINNKASTSFTLNNVCLHSLMLTYVYL